MEQVTQKMELLKLEEEQQRLKKEEAEVAKKLNNLKTKLDDLLLEKEAVDQRSAEVDKQLEDCKQSSRIKQQIKEVDIENGDEYKLIKCEFDQVTVDREKTLEKKKIVEKKMENMNNEFEMIVYERNKIRSEDQEIEERCEEMRKQFDTFNQKTSQSDLPDSFEDRLEIIRAAKEAILSEDKEIDEESRLLWIKAHAVKDQMFNNAKKHQLLDADNEEIQKLFNDITNERTKLIEKDNLLNGRYQIIHDNIQNVCEKRVELKVEIESKKAETESGDKDSVMQEDLELAVKQKEFENIFENWKKEKASLIQDNKDLDILLDNLMNKFELLKEKKRILVDEDIYLQNQSQELKSKFEMNQNRKDTAIENFKEKEQLTTDLVEEFKLLTNTGNDRTKDQEGEKSDKNIHHLLEEFEALKQRKNDLRVKDEEVTKKFVLANSEFEDLTEENNILTQYQEEIETVYEKLKTVLDSKKQTSSKDNNEKDSSAGGLKENLLKEKEVLTKKDLQIAEKFDKYDTEIEALENVARDLKTKQEEIEWETCLLGNELEE